VKLQTLTPDFMMNIWSDVTFPSLWSATPTPLTESLTVDEEAIPALVDHHLSLGVDGLFVAGTCGEGPWLPVRERRRLVQRVREVVDGRMRLAVQVSDNSPARILENAEWALDDGADVVVIAPPTFVMNVSPRTLFNHYGVAITESPLPVCLYDRGPAGGLGLPLEFLKELYLLPNVVMVKDSSADPVRNALALEARRERRDLRLFNGDEFNCVRYLEQGYDGLLIGGAIFNGVLARRIMEEVSLGNLAEAHSLQERMNKLMFAVYGGEKITCWLSGLKRLLVEMGVFNTWKNFPDYPLTPECEAAILELMDTDRDILLPQGLPVYDGG
jgi:dihydrodipicolinate synthase/N-acetylneuraminate lyase